MHDRVTGRVGSMDDLPFAEAELDLMGERLKRLRANLSALEEDSTALTLARETGR